MCILSPVRRREEEAEKSDDSPQLAEEILTVPENAAEMSKVAPGIPRKSRLNGDDGFTVRGEGK